MERIMCLVIGYIFGLFQTAYIYGKLNHIDIRQYGSGNAGTTNALRVLGPKAGIIVYFGDFLKCVIACMLTRFVIAYSMPDKAMLLMLYAGLGVVLGHNYPFYLKFKGGKGIAVTSAILFSILDWRILVPSFLVFVAVVGITRYVSLGSLVLVLQLLIEYSIFALRGDYGLAQSYIIESIVIVAIFTVLAFWKHRANIVRLIKGTENKLGAKNKKESEAQ